MYRFASAQELRRCQNGHVTLWDGTRIPTRTVIWAGGLKAASLSNNLEIKTGNGAGLMLKQTSPFPVSRVYMP